MAIDLINLTVPNGDTPRSANTKINANFSNPSHAAGRLVGIENGQIPKAEDTLKSSFYRQTPYIVSGDANNMTGGDFILTSPSVLNIPNATNYHQILTMRGYADSLIQQSYGYNTAGTTYTPNLYMRNKTFNNSVWSSWVKFYNTANTTKDSNGFIKAASPILQVYSDKIELNDDAKQQDITFTKNDIGDYTISGTSGLSTDGWYIELPKDLNGNPKVAVTLLEVDGVISLKSYKRIFSMNTFTFEPDLNEPMDVPDGRWIDIRLNEIENEDAPADADK